MVQSERFMSTIDWGIGSVLRAMRISVVIEVTIIGRFAIILQKNTQNYILSINVVNLPLVTKESV